MAHKRPGSMAFFILLVFITGPVIAEPPADETLSPYFFVESAGSAEAFLLLSTDVSVTVSGVIADVRVTQTYANDGSEPIHARYVFPASTRGAVHGMSIRVGDQAVVARIAERRQAKREFEQARTEGKSASLLEQQRPNVFTMSVANIMPGDRVDVELHYTELLVPTEGTYPFVYPAVVGPRYANRLEASAPDEDRWVKSPYLQAATPPPQQRFDIRVSLSTGLPLSEVRCASHEVDVAWEGTSIARVSLADPSLFGGDRDFLLDYRLVGSEIRSGLLIHRGETENFFLLMLQPPEAIRSGDVPPREYVFVLDVSGSMDGFPLETAKAVIASLITDLRETDRFNVILFAGGSNAMAPASIPATAENCAQAIRLIEQQRGGGGTELAAALEHAIGLPREEGFARTVAIITDGFVAAEREVFELIEDHLSGTSFCSFGIGSSVNRYLLEGLARAGQGEPFVVTRPEEARETAARFRSYIEFPLLTNIEVSYRGFEAYDVEPPRVPDLFAARPVVVFGKWRGELTGEIELAGDSSGGPYTRTLPVAGTEPLEESGALRYLWARTRISRLSDFGREDAETAGQVTSLGLTYSLLTRHTSFVAVLEQVSNPGGEAQSVEPPLPLPQGVSDLAVGGSYGAGSEPELWLLLAALGLGPLLAAVLRRLAPGLGP